MPRIDQVNEIDEQQKFESPEGTCGGPVEGTWDLKAIVSNYLQLRNELSLRGIRGLIVRTSK